MLYSLLACLVPAPERYTADIVYTWSLDESTREVTGNFDGAPLEPDPLLPNDVDVYTLESEHQAISEAEWSVHAGTATFWFGSTLLQGDAGGSPVQVSTELVDTTTEVFDIDDSPDAFRVDGRYLTVVDLEVTADGRTLSAEGVWVETTELTYTEPDRWDSRMSSLMSAATVDNGPSRKDCDDELCTAVDTVVDTFQVVIEGTRIR